MATMHLYGQNNLPRLSLLFLACQNWCYFDKICPTGRPVQFITKELASDKSNLHPKHEFFGIELIIIDQ